MNYYGKVVNLEVENKELKKRLELVSAEYNRLADASKSKNVIELENSLRYWEETAQNRKEENFEQHNAHQTICESFDKNMQEERGKVQSLRKQLEWETYTLECCSQNLVAQIAESQRLEKELKARIEEVQFWRNKAIDFDSRYETSQKELKASDGQILALTAEVKVWKEVAGNRKESRTRIKGELRHVQHQFNEETKLKDYWHGVATHGDGLYCDLLQVSKELKSSFENEINEEVSQLEGELQKSEIQKEFLRNTIWEQANKLESSSNEIRILKTALAKRTSELSFAKEQTASKLQDSNNDLKSENEIIKQNYGY